MTVGKLKRDISLMETDMPVKIQFEGCAVRDVENVYLEFYEGELCLFIEAKDNAF